MQVHCVTRLRRFQVLLALASGVSGSFEAMVLSGAPPVPFRMFSGYIPVTADESRQIFYWCGNLLVALTSQAALTACWAARFVEAETTPASMPLVLWTNGASNAVFSSLMVRERFISCCAGGPGCAALNRSLAGVG